MKSSSANRIAEIAKEIATRNGFNFFFSVRDNIIEGCRNRKTSETYDYDVENEEFIHNTCKQGNIEGIIAEAIAIVKEEESAKEATPSVPSYMENETEEAPEDALIDVVVEGFPNAIVLEDSNFYSVNLRTGCGAGVYPKTDWTLNEAVKDQLNYTLE